MPRVVVVVVGDATLDVSIIAGGPQRSGGDVPAEIRLGAGGQAANVAVRLARSGVATRLVAPVGDDAAGRLVRDLLAAEGPLLELTPLAATRTATVAVLVDPAGERSMLSDRTSLDTRRLEPLLAGAAWVHCSGYALADEGAGGQLTDLLATLAPASRRSVAGGSPAPGSPAASRLRERIGRLRPDLLLLARDEAESLVTGAGNDAVTGAAALRHLATVAIVTDGPSGSAAAIGEATVEVPPVELPEPATDATGAGDAYLATVIAELVGVTWPPGRSAIRGAMERASLAGAQVSRVRGAQARVPHEDGAR